MVNVIHLNTLLGIMIMMLLYLELSQMTGYINKFDGNKIRMSLLIKDKKLKNLQQNMEKKN